MDNTFIILSLNTKGRTVQKRTKKSEDNATENLWEEQKTGYVRINF